jgi:hypothetical protein
MARTPARRTPRSRSESTPTALGSPVEIRLIGHETDVQHLVTALQEAAGNSAGAVLYRPSRYTEGALRAYLTVVIPPAEEQQ